MKLPQLHLRDLFWLVLVCAVALGLWAECKRQISLKEIELQEQIEAAVKQAEEARKLRLEIARTAKAASWAHDLYGKMSSHVQLFPTNDQAIEYAGIYFKERLWEAEYSTVSAPD